MTKPREVAQDAEIEARVRETVREELITDMEKAMRTFSGFEQRAVGAVVAALRLDIAVTL